MNCYIIGCNGSFPEEFATEEVSKKRQTRFLSGRLLIDRSSPFFPSRSDEKIMRDDVKQTIISVRSFIADLGINAEDLENAHLFVANGSFIENNEQYLSKLPETYKRLPEHIDRSRKLYELYKLSPPLLALETLTNSTMSFISQYTGIKGHNATFGTTSIAAYYAIVEGINSFQKAANRYALINASNCGGGYSFLSNSAIQEYKSDWKESAAAGNLLLAQKKEDNALCKISLAKSGKTIPSLINRKISRRWNELIPEEAADLIIHSGAFHHDTFQEDNDYCTTLNQHVHSLFPKFGNMGASNIVMSIIDGIAQFENGYSKIDILDRDVYGRESLIRIEKC